jgi:chromosome segregation ATPase
MSERFSREAAKPRLAEARPEDVTPTGDEVAGLLDRLQQQAAEAGRLSGRVQDLEKALRAEREARRRVLDTLKRERRAAAAIKDRAERIERDAAGYAEVVAELEELRESAAVLEQQVQITWAQLLEGERQLALERRPLWRKLLGRRPAG